jgi:hypothetical protein
MAEEAPKSYLLLTLRSCDDLDDVTFTLAGTSGEKPGLWLQTTLPYDKDLAELEFAHKLTISVNGMVRQFAVVSVKPAPEATGVTLKMWDAPRPAEEPDPEPPQPDWFQLMNKSGALYQQMMWGNAFTAHSD